VVVQRKTNWLILASVGAQKGQLDIEQNAKKEGLLALLVALIHL
jgi:hypothetical protein